jgi:hypothetical protein
MFAILHALGMFVADLFKSRSRLEAENLFLRHQLTIAMRRHRLVFDCLACGMAQVVSRRLSCGGIVRASNSSGAGNLSQTWKTFLQNHTEAIAAIDMCVVPTLTFDVLFAFLVLGHGRRQLLWFQVTRHPTAEWLARQITEAFPWTSALAYLVRDNDRAYGHVFTSSGEGDGYPRSTDLSWITVAEWLCRTSDRRIALRVPGSNAHLRRGAPAANSFRLCGVLQSRAHAPGITEKCALASSRPTIWRYRRHSDPGWTASPIRPDMIFGKDRHGPAGKTGWIGRK